jgi:segregation and condensation protein B
MSQDEVTGSLADQAAAWVPPWARRPSDAGAVGAAAPPSAEPAEPADLAPEPAEPADLAPEPAEPADLAPEPAEPADLAPEPAEPELPPEPVLPAEPVEPGLVPEPALPAEPVEPELPPEPVLPAEPAEPALARETTLGPAPVEEQLSLVPDAPAPDEEQAPLVPDEELRAALEAILLVVDEPATEMMLAQIVGQPTDRVTALLSDLATEYDNGGRGFELRRIAGGWRFYTREKYASYVERFVLDGQQVRLTQAALETLAVVAYKQPVTRSRISAIRGVNCDGVVRTLLSRGLIEECGSEPDSNAHLYRTTTLFLEKLGLDSVEQLPPLAPFLPDDVEALADAGA